MQYKIEGGIEQGIHYTRFTEELEEEEQAKKSQEVEEVEDGGRTECNT